MAVTAPARRGRGNLRREPSEAIEEDDPSQAVAADSDPEDEIEAPPPTRAPKSSKNQKGKDTASADEAEIDGNMFDKLEDQPIDRVSAGKLSGMSEDWKKMRETIHGNSYALIRDVAATMAEFDEDDDSKGPLEELEETMRNLVDTENELRFHEQALNELHQKIVRGEPINAIALYDDGVQRQKQEYKTKTLRKKYAKNEEYISYRQAIYEVQHPEQPMPPVSEFLDREEGDDSDEDDDIVMGGVTQDYKCPLSLTIMVDPLTSNTCGHSFSAEAIRQYLGNNLTSRKKCPTSGCNKVISLDDLKPNKELAKKAREAARRERMREEEDEDMGEEIID
ncbi:hypothetical protein BDY19DRAFT_894649 [Irpex rosettiformis]|uniref:Uncharacterized protein n=1 Tax=Irpex rosettiformis TaxID=378272 RepID=A0ACB8TX20_9APHY|nr:hypothetical protein BDY19DRAFT_894649 [Irpex rosettiformis]